LTALKDVCKRPEDFDAAVRTKSEGLLTRFIDFETLITLMVFKKIFDIVGPLNRVRSRAMCSGGRYSGGETSDSLDARSNNVIRDAKVTAETLEIAPQLQEKRLRKKKPLFDDGADKRTSDPNEQWINEVFLTAIDTAQAILKEKFSGQHTMLLSLSAFLPTSFCDVERITEEHVKTFIDQFKLDIRAESLTAECGLREFAELCIHSQPELVTVREKNSLSVLLHIRKEIGFSFLPSFIGVHNSGNYTNIVDGM